MRPSYKQAIKWIANEDNPGDNELTERLEGYITVNLIADLFGKDVHTVARDVYVLRKNERLTALAEKIRKANTL